MQPQQVLDETSIFHSIFSAQSTDNPRSLLLARCLMWRKTRMEEGERTTVNFGLAGWRARKKEIWEWDRANVAQRVCVRPSPSLPIVSFTDGHVPLRSPFPFPSLHPPLCSLISRVGTTWRRGGVIANPAGAGVSACEIFDNMVALFHSYSLMWPSL